MSSTSYDITIDQGGTFTLTISMLDASNNNVLVGATDALAQIRESFSSNVIVATFDHAFAANNASLTLSLSANTTQNFTKKSAHWDVKVIWPDHEDFILRGKATTNFTVSRT